MEVKQILREWDDYQHRHGVWPRSHWAELARKADRPVSDFCPYLKDMPAFVAEHEGKVEADPPPPPPPRSRVRRPAVD